MVNLDADSSDDVSLFSRRHEAGAPSARALLLTLLGEFALRSGGYAWTSAVIEALREVGVEEKTTRQALMRSATAGWLTSERQGRRTRWLLTPVAKATLSEGADRIYSFADPQPGWNGQWLIVSARVPESDRSARHALRTRFSWAGFGSLAPGLWISTHVDREDEVAGILRDTKMDQLAHVFVATRVAIGDIRETVNEAWNLDDVNDEYRHFVDAFTNLRDQVLARQILLVHAWRRFPAIDPRLPRELLPNRWHGVTAAALFTRLHDDWHGPAQARWRELNDDPR